MRSQRCSRPTVRPGECRNADEEESGDGFLGMADEDENEEEQEDDFWNWAIEDEDEAREEEGQRESAHTEIPHHM